MTNCPNCGGELDIYKNKCVYCGAPIFDIAAIGIGKPSIIQLYYGGKLFCIKGVAKSIRIEQYDPNVTPEMSVDFDLHV